MPLGFHISIADGLSNAVKKAEELGCDTMQIFTHSPRDWRSKSFDDKDVKEFKAAVKQSAINPVAVHASYLINLSSPDENIYNRSINLFIHEIKTAQIIGADMLVAHLGSTKGFGDEFGLKRVIKALSAALKKYRGSTKILLENTTGSGWTFGWKLEDIGRIINAFGKDDRLGFCFDTCHGFAAGYPLDNLDMLVRNIDKSVGIENLRLIHLNDSMGRLGSRKDLHQHIGRGYIGINGFRAILNHLMLKDIPMIMETPKKSDRDDRRNMKVARGLIV